MFINFSNHPSKLWAEDERNAALQYGTIEDLAFPQVPAQPEPVLPQQWQFPAV